MGGICKALPEFPDTELLNGGLNQLPQSALGLLDIVVSGGLAGMDRSEELTPQRIQLEQLGGFQSGEAVREYVELLLLFYSMLGGRSARFVMLAGVLQHDATVCYVVHEKKGIETHRGTVPDRLGR